MHWWSGIVAGAPWSSIGFWASCLVRARVRVRVRVGVRVRVRVRVTARVRVLGELPG